MTQMTIQSEEINNDKFYGLDHLRALAIALVLIYHFLLFQHPQWLEKVNKFGWSGVDLFFVLSGYLIASQLFLTMIQNQKIPIKEFYLKRLFRIIPAYMVVLMIYFCVPAFHEREALPPLWKFLTFTQNFGLDVRYLGTFSHAWSLCIEEHFYLLLPLILSALLFVRIEKTGFILVIVLFIFGFFARIYSWQLYDLPGSHISKWGLYIYYPTYNRLDGLLVGVTIAGLYYFVPKIKNRFLRYGNLFLGFSMLILTGAYILCLDQSSYCASIFGFPLVSIGYGFMVLSAICPSSILYKFKSKTTTTIATLSYAIYLSHKGLIHITQNLFSKLGVRETGNFMFILCIVASIIGAFILNKFIEQPFMKMRYKLIRKLSGNVF